MSKKPTTAEIEANLGLVYKVVHSHPSYYARHEKDDLIAWGTLGLIHALEHFDDGLGFKFSTYACKCIWGYLLQGMRSTQKEQWYMSERGHKTVTLQMTEEIQRKLVDDRVTEEWVVAEIDHHTLQQYIEAAKGVLTDRQGQIVTLMLANDLNQATVAQVTGTSRQNIGIVWNVALGRMKTYFEENHNGWTTQSR